MPVQQVASVHQNGTAAKRAQAGVNKREFEVVPIIKLSQAWNYSASQRLCGTVDRRGIHLGQGVGGSEQTQDTREQAVPEASLASP